MSFGFIILRHVNSNETNEYWKECYDCIRKFYNYPILIIDDNSDKGFLTEEKLVNTTIIDSEFEKGKGELLPYYYYHKYKFAETAIILHDSVFIQEKIDFGSNIKFLWEFPNSIRHNVFHERHLLNQLDNWEILSYLYETTVWNGCFGGMMVIPHDFVNYLQDTHNIFNLLKFMKTRDSRMYFERVIAILVHASTKQSESLFGNILKYCRYNYSYSEYKQNPLKKPIIKVWTGR